MTVERLELEKQENWTQRLNAYFAEVKDEKFEWGTFDCCFFSAGAVEAETGVDPMAEFRGTYTSEEEANEVLKEIGDGNLFRTLYKKFGKPVKGAHGRRGDVAWYEGACGIVIGRQAIFLMEGGFGFVPISHVERAFKVAW